MPEQEGANERLLLELAMTDLELSLCAKLQIRAEHYFDAYAVLKRNDYELELIGHEIVIRSKLNEQLNRAEFEARFPDHAEKLTDRFSEMLVPDINDYPKEFQTGQMAPDQRYELKEFFAEGGVGAVWLAYDHILGRRVAIKRVKDSIARNRLDLAEQYYARLSREAAITGCLEHPGIVPIHDQGKFANGQPFFAMKFIEGQSLHQQIEQVHATSIRSSDIPKPYRPLIATLTEVCKAIRYAHTQGVIHRDLKPLNIIVGKHGGTFVIDWGLAKSLNENDSETDLAVDVGPTNGAKIYETKHGTVMGSPGYMSPEQELGHGDLVSRRSDVFSLGGILFTILTGKVPDFSKDELKGELRASPAPLRSICLKAMSPDTADRFSSPAELADELDRYLAGDKVECHSESLVEKSIRLGQNNFQLVALGTLGLLLMTALSLVAAYRIQVALRESEAARDDLIETLQTFNRVLLPIATNKFEEGVEPLDLPQRRSIANFQTRQFINEDLPTTATKAFELTLGLNTASQLHYYIYKDSQEEQDLLRAISIGKRSTETAAFCETPNHLVATVYLQGELLLNLYDSDKKAATLKKAKGRFDQAFQLCTENPQLKVELAKTTYWLAEYHIRDNNMQKAKQFLDQAEVATKQCDETTQKQVLTRIESLRETLSASERPQ